MFVWLFAGIERISKRRFVVPLIGQKRDKATLLPLIQKCIKPGSVIYSDSGAAYKDIQTLGYQHYMINHKENLVDTTYTHRTSNVFGEI
uniref:ISXO2-like transposase domain-containing protein n=1 Tax=Octopus bimaculoides TaxID=37653 RepID=A0A0L8HD62_OCTBM